MSHQPKVSNNVGGKIKKQKENSDEDPSKNLLQVQTPIVNLSCSKYFDRVYSEDYSNNLVYTWGSNEMGQLGQDYDNPMNKDKEYIFSSTPLLLNLLKNKQINKVSAGDGHTVCVTKGGNVYSWGASACGQLGLEGIDSMPKDSEGYPCQPTPCLVKLLLNTKIKEIACGDAHTLALTLDGKIYSWGGAGCGQLGHQNINEMPKDADGCPYQPFPRVVDNLKNMINISCGKAHSIGIDSSGCLFSWGAGACGQLGVEDIHTLPVDDDGYPYQPIPRLVKSLKGQNIVMGVCGDVHTLILNDKGELFSFGGGSFGQLGLGPISKMPLDADSYPYMPIPSKIEALSDLNIVYIACGDSHSMAIDSEGLLYGFGAAACGQLGFENLTSLPKDGEGNPYEPNPRLVNFFESMKVVNVACGETHTLVLIEGGIIYSFGGSSCGQLGYCEKSSTLSKLTPSNSRNSSSLLSKSESSLNNSWKPKIIHSLLGKNIRKIACGGVHNICLVEQDNPFNYDLFRLMRTQTYCDFEFKIEHQSTVNSLKCHKFVLRSRSKFFFEKLKGGVKTLNVKGFDLSLVRLVVDYLYLNDNQFLEEVKSLDILLDLLKMTKNWELTNLSAQVERKLRSMLNRYSEALQAIHTSTDDEDFETEGSSTDFKGLFFLPNGNPILVLDEGLMKDILKNSIVIPLVQDNLFKSTQGNSNNLTNNSKLTQKNLQELGVNSLREVNNKKTTMIKKSFNSSNALKVSTFDELSCINTSEKDFSVKAFLSTEKLDNTSITNEDVEVKKDAIDEEIQKTEAETANFGASSITDSPTKATEVLHSEEKASTNLNEESLTFDVNSYLNKSGLIEGNQWKECGDFLKFLNNQEISDVTLKIGGKNIYCNSIILTSRSKYFETMFSCDNLAETNNRTVDIKDFEYDDLMLLLAFLYSDKDYFTLSIKQAITLLKGADRFCVDYLKNYLESYLSAKIEVENAAVIFQYSSYYNHERLKKICLAFINENYKQVIETQEFEELQRECMIEIVRYCRK